MRAAADNQRVDLSKENNFAGTVILGPAANPFWDKVETVASVLSRIQGNIFGVGVIGENLPSGLVLDAINDPIANYELVPVWLYENLGGGKYSFTEQQPDLNDITGDDEGDFEDKTIGARYSVGYARDEEIWEFNLNPSVPVPSEQIAVVKFTAGRSPVLRFQYCCTGSGTSSGVSSVSSAVSSVVSSAVSVVSSGGSVVSSSTTRCTICVHGAGDALSNGIYRPAGTNVWEKDGGGRFIIVFEFFVGPTLTREYQIVGDIPGVDVYYVSEEFPVALFPDCPDIVEPWVANLVKYNPVPQVTQDLSQCGSSTTSIVSSGISSGGASDVSSAAVSSGIPSSGALVVSSGIPSSGALVVSSGGTSEVSSAAVSSDVVVVSSEITSGVSSAPSSITDCGGVANVRVTLSGVDAGACTGCHPESGYWKWSGVNVDGVYIVPVTLAAVGFLADCGNTVCCFEACIPIDTVSRMEYDDEECSSLVTTTNYDYMAIEISITTIPPFTIGFFNFLYRTDSSCNPHSGLQSTVGPYNGTFSGQTVGTLISNTRTPCNEFNASTTGTGKIEFI